MAWGLGKKSKDNVKENAKGQVEAKAEPKSAAMIQAAPEGKAGTQAQSSSAGASQQKDANSESARHQASMLAMAANAQKARFTQNFAQAVGVMMRDTNYRNLPVKDLEHVLLPAIIAGQCAVGYSKPAEKAPAMPVALALWAKVSTAIDKRFSEQLDKPMQLKATEWQSGDIYWIVTLAGVPSQFNEFLQQLLTRDLKGKTVKMRLTDKSGNRTVQVLSGGKV